QFSLSQFSSSKVRRHGFGIAQSPPSPASPSHLHRAVTSVAQSPPLCSHLLRPVTSVAQQPSFVGTATSITLEGAFELPRVPDLRQRGFSLYYLDRFEEGAEQFQLDVAQNPNDTEESIWCFLCEAQLYGVDEARK
ncbi:hypothetical protein HN51_026150, partial [Arachis hypogaea]